MNKELGQNKKTGCSTKKQVTKNNKGVVKTRSKNKRRKMCVCMFRRVAASFLWIFYILN